MLKRMARPRYQEGTLKRRKAVNLPDAWIGYWHVYVYADGQQKRRKREKLLGLCTEINKAAARVKLLKLIAQSTGQISTRGGATLDAAWTRYKATNGGAWSESHRKSVDGSMKRPLDAFGAVAVDELDRQQFQEWLQSLQVSFSLANKIKTNTLAALDLMVRDGYLRRNPLEGVKVHQRKPAQGQYLTIEQVRAMLTACDSQRDHIMLALLALCGLRPAEVAALRASSLDAAERRVRVSESAPREGLKATKTKGSRGWVPIPEALATEMSEYIAAAGFEADDFLFPGSSRDTLRMEAWRRRSFAAICARAGVTSDLRALRRTAATWITQNGGIKAAQAVLRHAKPDMTAMVYAGAVPDETRRAVDDFAKEVMQ